MISYFKANFGKRIGLAVAGILNEWASRVMVRCY